MKDGIGNELDRRRRYYIQNAKQYVGNSVLWWRPHGAGYTTNLKEAGTYIARDLEGLHPKEHIPWPDDYVRTLVEQHVDAQKLSAGKKLHQDAGSIGVAKKKGSARGV